MRTTWSQGFELCTAMGRLRDAAVHNTAQPEPKHENSNGVGPHSGARVPSAAQPERRSRSSNEEGPHSEHCRTQHGPAGTKARELRRRWAAFGRAGTFCGPAGAKVSDFKRGRATFRTLPYTTRPSRNQSPRAQTGSGRIWARGLGAAATPRRPRCLPRGWRIHRWWK